MRCAERARDSQPECFDDQLQGRQIQRPCRLHQLAGNRYRHLGMPFRLEVDPRSSTGLSFSNSASSSAAAIIRSSGSNFISSALS